MQNTTDRGEICALNKGHITGASFDSAEVVKANKI